MTKRRIRAIAGAACVVAVVLMFPGPALADNGMGTFTGYEIPPETVNFTNETTMCAEFVASSSDPLIHELQMAGTFHDETGSGSATFTRTSPYYLNPEGTYSDEDCMNEATVSGLMTIEFETYDCSGSGTYERRNQGVYTLVFDGTCDDTTTQGTVETISTEVTFTGSQVPCPPATCTGYPSDAAAEMSGTYSQTH